MQLRRLDVQNSLTAVRCGTTSLLHNEREGSGLVQKTQFATFILAIGWIREQPTAEQIAMEIGNEGTDIACVHRLPVSVLTAIIAHQVLDVGLPLAVV